MKNKLWSLGHARFVSLLLVLTMMVSVLSGCGSEQGINGDSEEDDHAASLPEYTYVASYENIENETGNYWGLEIFDETGFYYSESYYDDDTKTSVSNFFHYNINTKAKDELPIEMSDQEYAVRGIVDQSGRLLLLSQESDYSTEEYQSYFYVYVYDPVTGEVVKTDITDTLQTEDDYMYVSVMMVDSEGKLYLSNSDSKIWILDTSLQLLKTITMSDYPSFMGISRNDQLVYGTYDDNGGNLLKIYDSTSDSFVDGELLPTNIYAYGGMKRGIEADFLIETDMGLSEFSIADNSITEVVNWINSDVNGSYVSDYTVLSDGRILLLSEDWTGDEVSHELVFLTKTNSSELPVKELISLKVLYLDYDLKKKVIDFNKSNDKYRIVVENYDLTDYEAAQTQYRMDMVTGNASDIILIDDSSITKLANKGILEDLYPWIDQDEEYRRDDFFQNVFDAYSVDGKLYGITSAVNIVSLMAKEKFVGNTSGWTAKDLMELSNTLPEGTEFFEYGSKQGVLNMLVGYDLNSYINWLTGECRFNSDDFKYLMEFANKYEESSDIIPLMRSDIAIEEPIYDDGYVDEEYLTTPEKIAMDRLILIQLYASSLTDYQYTISQFNETPTVIGYPSMEGNGTYISGMGTTLGINASSSHKEGAWQFIRYMLSEEASEDSWGVPVRKDVFEEKMKEQMTPTYFGEDDYNYVPEDDWKIAEDGRIEQPKNQIYMGNETVYLYAPTQEMADQFEALYKSTSTLYGYNDEILSIINEETAAYFEGQKDAASVADIIQSRLLIYVNENR